MSVRGDVGASSSRGKAPPSCGTFGLLHLEGGSTEIRPVVDFFSGLVYYTLTGVAVKDPVPLSPLEPSAAPADTEQQSTERANSALSNDLQPPRVSMETSTLRPQTPKAEDEVEEDYEVSGALTISELVYRSGLAEQWNSPCQRSFIRDSDVFLFPAPVPACCPRLWMTVREASTCSSLLFRARHGCWGSSTQTPTSRPSWRPRGSETGPMNALDWPQEVGWEASWAAACVCCRPTRESTLVCWASPASWPWSWASCLSLCPPCCCCWSPTSTCRFSTRSARRRSLSSFTTSITAHCAAGSCVRSAWPWRTCGQTKDRT